MRCISKQWTDICDMQRDEIDRLKEKLEAAERERDYWEAVAEGWMEKYDSQRDIANQLVEEFCEKLGDR